MGSEIVRADTARLYPLYLWAANTAMERIGGTGRVEGGDQAGTPKNEPTWATRAFSGPDRRLPDRATA